MLTGSSLRPIWLPINFKLEPHSKMFSIYIFLLYIFDRSLRLLIFDAVECIEVSFRNDCAHHARLWNREFTVTFKVISSRNYNLSKELILGSRKIYLQFFGDASLSHGSNCVPSYLG